MADNYSLKEVFGGKDSEAYKNYKQGQKEGKWSDYNDYVSKGGNSTGSGGVNANIERFLQANREAIKPAVQSYQASIPETQQRFETQRTQVAAEREPLTARFENLINQVKSGYERNRTAATTTTSNELGRRGILGSSGVADRELQAAVAPINTAESQAITDIGFEREAQLRNLENTLANSYLNETSAVRDITNAIAGLQSTAGMASIPQALNLYGTELQSSQFNKQLEQAANQFAKNYELNKATTDYNISKPYYQPQQTTDFTELFKILFPNTNNPASNGQTPQYTPSRNGIVEGNFISQNGTWIPRYEVVQ